MKTKSYRNILFLFFISVLVITFSTGCPSQKAPKTIGGGGSNDTSSGGGGPRLIKTNSLNTITGGGSNDTSSGGGGGPRLIKKKSKAKTTRKDTTSQGL